MSPGQIATLDPEIDRDPDILLIRLDFAFSQVSKYRRKEIEARNTLARTQEEGRLLSQDCMRLKDVEHELTHALTETRELRLKAEVATARLVDLKNLREENRELREQIQLTGQAEKVLAIAQAELRELRLKLQSAEARLTDIERLAAENRALREEVAELRAETATASATQAELREARHKLQSADAKLSDTERLANENQALRQEVAEMRQNEDAVSQLAKLTTEYKQLRIDHEQLERRLADDGHKQEELFELRVRAAEFSRFADEVGELRERERSLEAQLYAAGIEPRTRSVLPSVPPAAAGTVAHDIETNLKSLIGPEGARSAVLGDHHGLLVAGAGDRIPQEGMAAFIGYSIEVGERSRTILPLSTLQTVQLADINGVVVSCRFFQCEEALMGVATIATSEVAAANTEQATAKIVQNITMT